MKKIISQEIDLLSFLKENFPSSSTNKLRKMLSSGRIKINGEIIHAAKKVLTNGDLVELLDKSSINPIPNLANKQDKLPIDLIYEDDQILVVCKPSKLLSIATDRLESDTLHSKCVDYLKQTDTRSWAYIVHRLDKETSGIMLLAKSKSAKDYLQEQFSQRSVYRIYYALVEGHPEGTSGTISQYLFEDKNLNIKPTSKSNKQGKQAITHWELISTNGNTSIVRVMIETGRRHQIRMALKSIGHPIVGDLTHGATINPLARICLHATSLEFLHPKDDEPVRFEAKHPFKLL